MNLSLNKTTFLLMCSFLALTMFCYEPAFAVNIGGIASQAQTMFSDINKTMQIIGAGIAVIGFIWACIEYFVSKSPISECAKILGVAVLVGGAIIFVTAAVDFGKGIK